MPRLTRTPAAGPMPPAPAGVVDGASGAGTFGARGDDAPGEAFRARPTDPGHRGPRHILAVASGGGHWVQLLRLRPAFAGHEVTWVTVDARSREDVGFEPFHVVPDATRWNPLGLAVLAIRLAVVVLRTRPDVVVTTGAAPGLLATWLARMVGARPVWIDSLANVRRPSLSGRLAARACRLQLVQWPGLARADGPRFFGSVA